MVRTERVQQTVKTITDSLQGQKLTSEEVILVLSNLLIKVGYTLFFKMETNEKERPQLGISREEVEKLYRESPSTGGSLMKIGFDLQYYLLVKEE